MRGMLQQLRATGFRVALDDFGTGYSSLSYLQRFAVDKIKIDRSFVQQVGLKASSSALIEAIVMIGRTMHLTVTAEGVETEAQRAYLSEIGCDQMQGYRFAAACSEEQLDALLAAHGRIRIAA